MFASNITLNNAAAAAKTFVLVSTGTSNSIRMDNGTTNVAPRKMLISHAVSTLRDGTVQDRHLLSFQMTKINATGKPVSLVLNRSLAYPRDPIFTVTDVADLVAFDRNWTGVQANLDGWYLGEF